jgi:hypothetical protein
MRVEGAITAAMRAAPVRGARILRLARVEGGRIVDETRHRNTIAFEGATLRVRSGRWTLCLVDGVTARVAGAPPLVGPVEVPLDADARGKIRCGSVDHLFQLVIAPPPVVAQLPISAVDRTASIDWRFAIIVAVSLFVHFGVMGMVHADWFDPSVDEDGGTARLITEPRARPPVPVEDQPAISNEPVKVAAGSEPAKAAKAAPPKRHTDLSALTNTLDQIGLSTIASIGKGPAQSKLLHEPVAADGALDELAKKSGGVEADGPKIKGDPSGIDPLKSDGKLADIGDTKTNTQKAPPAPTGEPSYHPNEPVIAPPSGVVPKDVNAVIAKNRWKLKACYSKELGANDHAEGTIRVKVTVSVEGDVESAVGSSSDLSPTAVACVENAFRGMKFGADENKSTFSVPIVFKSK